MLPLSPSVLKCFLAGALITLTAAGTPASADELAKNLGPVGPHEAMITTVGSNRVIAFFVRGNGNCHVQAVIWQAEDVEATTAAGFRISLQAGQTASIDSADHKSLSLKCGDYAESLAAVDAKQSVALNEQ